jgi:3-oxoadipate enol-lactonase
MPTLNLSPGVDLFYQIDDFTDPWSSPETVVFLHGLAESGVAWRPWVPYFGRHYRLIRVDQRGFGNSTPTPADFQWSIDVPADDLARLASELKESSFHLVSAKFGGTVAMRFAAKYPGLVKSLSVISSPTSLRKSLGQQIPAWQKLIKAEGVRSWASSTMGGRLGSDAAPEATEWWTELMGSAHTSTVVGIMRNLIEVDVTPDLPNIHCPTLVMTTTGSGLGSVEAVRDWQRLIPRSELVVLDDDSYHVAAAKPDECAKAVREFISRH